MRRRGDVSTVTIHSSEVCAAEARSSCEERLGSCREVRRREREGGACVRESLREVRRREREGGACTPAPAASQQMQLFVQGAIAAKTVCITVASRDTSIDVVRSQIQLRAALAPCNMRLLSGARELQDGRTLADYHITDYATIAVARSAHHTCRKCCGESWESWDRATVEALGDSITAPIIAALPDGNWDAMTWSQRLSTLNAARGLVTALVERGLRRRFVFFRELRGAVSTQVPGGVYVLAGVHDQGAFYVRRQVPPKSWRDPAKEVAEAGNLYHGPTWIFKEHHTGGDGTLRSIWVCGSHCPRERFGGGYGLMSDKTRGRTVGGIEELPEDPENAWPENAFQWLLDFNRLRIGPMVMRRCSLARLSVDIENHFIVTAFAMGLHARLGAGSHVRLLAPDTLACIAKFVRIHQAETKRALQKLLARR